MRFPRRKRSRQARHLARLLVELEDVARERRGRPPRPTLRASLGGSRS